MTYRGAHIDDFREAFRRIAVSDRPSDWAIIKAYRNTYKDKSFVKDEWIIDGYRDFPCNGEAPAILELARMIEKYEQPPIDPDEEAVKDILRTWHSDPLDDYLSGVHFESALAVYRKYKAAPNAL